MMADTLDFYIEDMDTIEFEFESAGGATISDYNLLINKPSIEGHTLIGDSTIKQIGVNELTPQDIDKIIFG